MGCAASKNRLCSIFSLSPSVPLPNSSPLSGHLVGRADRTDSAFDSSLFPPPGNHVFSPELWRFLGENEMSLRQIDCRAPDRAGGRILSPFFPPPPPLQLSTETAVVFEMREHERVDRKIALFPPPFPSLSFLPTPRASDTRHFVGEITDLVPHASGASQNPPPFSPP